MLVKICGMRRQEDLLAAARAGADFCGFIFHPKSPRHIDPVQASVLDTPGMVRVGVFVEDNYGAIAETMRTARLDFAQLHGGQGAACARSIGGERVIRVIWPQRHARMADLLAHAQSLAADCSYFLLDAGKAGGGSGACLDWETLRNLALPRPWFLAGGLDASNIKKVLSACSPDGLDFNSGLEDAPGVKNHGKIRAALGQIQPLRAQTPR